MIGEQHTIKKKVFSFFFLLAFDEQTKGGEKIKTAIKTRKLYGKYTGTRRTNEKKTVK